MFLHTFYLYLQLISANFIMKIQVIPSQKKKKKNIYIYIYKNKFGLTRKWAHANAVILLSLSVSGLKIAHLWFILKLKINARDTTVIMQEATAFHLKRKSLYLTPALYTNTHTLPPFTAQSSVSIVRVCDFSEVKISLNFSLNSKFQDLNWFPFIYSS